MTSEWKQAIRDKRKFAVQFAKDSSLKNFKLKRKYRNIATRERRKAIKPYWYRKSEELKSKPSDFFNTFKPFIGTKAKDTNPTCLKSEDGEVEKDQTVVAELLAGHFNTVAAYIGGNHITSLTENDQRNHSSVKAVEGGYKGNKFDFKEFNKEEVQCSLKSLNVRESYGWDVTAPPTLLQGVAEGIAPSLTRLYNNCTDLGEWPAEWTPVFKEGDRQDKLNYRPMKSLICVDKIFEHLVNKEKTTHYDPALCQRMTAYRKQHSCETTLLMLIEDWKLAVDRKDNMFCRLEL
ncbi:hypothetical protein P5673_015271 [Acropora cervicornis]|uniref:Uncharacterized protein n=1 Tax=Acropora cervicornis TaxID=6130 RepID=A0AAD9QIG7_ACRCE|nr:hypothetical protein P5673_015271 [Acropora cervicornis]